jgi:hypothetical protein
MFAYTSNSTERLSRLVGTSTPALIDFRIDEYFATDPRLRHRACLSHGPAGRD